MFNIGGPEFLVILLVALIVLGPTRLPDAVRQIGKFMGEAKRLSSNFQNEVNDAMKDPVKKATGKELPKSARDVVGFAVNEPFQGFEPAKANADTKIEVEQDPKASDSEPAKEEAAQKESAREESADEAAAASSRLGSTDDEASGGDGAQGTAPTETTSARTSKIEPAHIATAVPVTPVETSPPDSDDETDIPMFGDR